MTLLLTSFADVASYAFYILVAVLVLLVMITVHEFGHYVAGKIFGFGITEFSIGFGPKLFQKKKKDGELFSVRLLPLGGYCAFVGEDEDSDSIVAFNNKKPWQRIIVLISGALMNYILAVVIIMVNFAAYGQTALCPVNLVENPSYSAEYSFLSKDVIISANGKNIYLTTDLMNALSGKKQGEKVKFSLRRNGERIEKQIILRGNADFKNYEDIKVLYDVLGIYYETDSSGKITDSGLYSTLIRFSFFETVGRGFEYSFKIAGTIFGVLGQLLTGRIGISSMGGTITTITATADAVRNGGLRYLLHITSFIGVNLAVFNLLPIPALDGSRVVFTAIEWVRRKPLKRKVEAIIHAVGFALILIFAVILDLQRCF
ncbi:MAG: M50 family metallopeptidase [Clostridia bacterium]|nr:M50 family metallopeptidase [Clostridia bacterium]